MATAATRPAADGETDSIDTAQEAGEGLGLPGSHGMSTHWNGRLEAEYIYTPHERITFAELLDGRFQRIIADMATDRAAQQWLEYAQVDAKPTADRTPRGKPLAPLADWLKRADALLG